MLIVNSLKLTRETQSSQTSMRERFGSEMAVGDDVNGYISYSHVHTATYLYVDTVFGGTGMALLESQMFQPEQHNNLCFHFWFFIQVRHSKYLTMKILRMKRR